MLIPAIMFAGVIMSGVFYIARNLVWSEGVFIANDFWKGLKSNILSFLLMSCLLGIVLFVTSINISILNQTSFLDAGSFLAKPFVNNLVKGLSYVFCGFFVMMTFYSFTITVTYKVKFTQLIKNSFILSLGLLPKNLLFLLIALSPEILLMLFPSGMFVGLLLGIILLLGLSLGVIVWTIYSHWVFDTYLNDRVEGAVKNRGLYQKMAKDGKVVNKKSWFENPKKKKIKPVNDEDVKITELPTNFSRADLAKLAAEKEHIKEDSEKWSEEHADDDENESEDDDTAYEGNEDAMKLEGFEEGENPEEADEKGEDTEEDKDDK